MLTTLFFAAMCLLPGLPAAVALRTLRPAGTPAAPDGSPPSQPEDDILPASAGGSSDPSVEPARWGDLLVEGLVLGLGWWLVLGLLAVHHRAFERPVLVGATVLVAAALAVFAAPELSRLPWPRVSTIGVVTVAVVALGAWVRRDPFYLIYQTSDFSEYINTANRIADGGGFSSWFVRLFPVPLALSGLALGRDATVAVMPFLGLLVPVLVASIARRLGVAPWAAVVGLAVVTFDHVPVWFSRFPASETLYAVLLLSMALLLLLALQRGRAHEAVLAGGWAGLMMLTRGNAVLLLLLLPLALVLTAFVVPRRILWLASTFTVAAVAFLYAGFVYDSVYSRAYFVDYQLLEFVPGALFPYVDALDRPVGATVGALVLVVALVGLTRGVVVLNRRVGPGAPGRAARTRAAALPVAFGIGLLALWPLDQAGLVDALSRYGPAVTLLTAAGTAIVLATVATRARPEARPLLVLAVVVAGGFALLHAYRVDEVRWAHFHLYWDRYLVSEVLPLMAVLALWALGTGARLLRSPALRRRGSALLGPALAGRTLAGPILGGIAVVLVGVLTWWGWDLGRLARERTLFDGAYEQVAALDEMTSSPERLPVVWSGFGEGELPEEWIHSNSWRVFATPLAESFDRRVLNLQVGAFAPDPTPSEEDLAALLRAHGVTRAYVVSVAETGAGSEGDGEQTPAVALAATGAPVVRTPVGRLDVSIPVLRQRPDHRLEAWREFDLTLRVSLAELP